MNNSDDDRIRAAATRLIATEADEHLAFGALPDYALHKEFDEAWDELRKALAVARPQQPL